MNRNENQDTENDEGMNPGYTPFEDIPYTFASASVSDEGPTFTFMENSAVEDGYQYGFVPQIGDDDDDDSYDETQPHEETFHANNTAGDNHEENIEIGVCSNDNMNVHDNDFHLIAEQALQSLEMEYNETKGFDTIHNTISNSELQQDENGVDCNDIDELENDTDLKAESNDITILSRKIPEIDTNAVAKAVQKISLSAPNLEKKFSNWSPTDPSYNVLTIPDNHSLIPSNSLLGFKRNTAKARASSANLTRSATLAEALQVLYKLDSKQDGLDAICPIYNEDEIFVIHCIGADLVECQTVETIRKAFKPIVKWMHQYQHFEYGMQNNDDTATKNTKSAKIQWPKHLRIELLGPCVPLHSTKFGVINLLPSNTPGRLESATVVCKNCMYHDLLNELEVKGRKDTNEQPFQSLEFPNLVIVFNAGIWGYNSWHPTLKKMFTFERPIPFVITAYTLYECEDDLEVLEELLESSLEKSSRRYLWGPRLNAYASRVERETKSSSNIYYENGAWQAYIFGNL